MGHNKQLSQSTYVVVVQIPHSYHWEHYACGINLSHCYQLLKHQVNISVQRRCWCGHVLDVSSLSLLVLSLPFSLCCSPAPSLPFACAFIFQEDTPVQVCCNYLTTLFKEEWVEALLSLEPLPSSQSVRLHAQLSRITTIAGLCYSVR